MDSLALIARYEAILKTKKIPKMQFYRECGITDAAVSQWRKGKTNPAMTTISRIAEYLDVTVEYLLTGEDQQKKPAPVGDELNEKNRGLITWFRSLPPEKQRALLISQDGPVELADE